MEHERNQEPPWVFDAKQLSDAELIARLKRCVARDRQLTARLLEHFAEVQARGLYRDQGYSSMFAYAVHALNMSEDEAGLRLTVSRTCRRFPQAIAMLARGELNMTTIKLLAPVLTQDNAGLLEQARFKSKQQVLELRAKLFPQPDVPQSTRKLPERTNRQPAATAMPPATLQPCAAPLSPEQSCALPMQSNPDLTANAQAPTGTGAAIAAQTRAVTPPSACVNAGALTSTPFDPANSPRESFAAHARTGVEASAESHLANVPLSMTAHATAPTPVEVAQSTQPPQAGASDTDTSQSTVPSFRLEPRVPAPTVVPLSEGRHMIRFTAEQRILDKLRQAQDLMRHQLPSGDLAAIFERGLDLLIAERKKKLFGQTDKPRPSRRTDRAPEANSRYVPRAVLREVVARDGEQCTFVSLDGRRCTERGRLQPDHYPTPFARGGKATADNLRLRCASHNLLTAEREFGRAFILERIAAARASSAARSSSDRERGPDRTTAECKTRKPDSQKRSADEPTAPARTGAPALQDPDLFASAPQADRERRQPAT